MNLIKFLPLSQGKFAIIDNGDFEKVGHFKWCALKKGRNFYAARTVWAGTKSKKVYLHNVIMGIKGVDHKDGDGLNCRQENMRPATKKQNAQAFKRRQLGVSSKFRGVCWDKSTRKWYAQIQCDGHNHNLGRFVHEKEAARAYDKKAIELGFFKEALNFPESAQTENSVFDKSNNGVHIA